MRVVGLDISTKTGMVILDENLNVLLAKELNIKVYKSNLDRANKMSFLVMENLNLPQYKRPGLVVLEGYGYSNTNTLVTLAEIGTAIRLSLLRNNIRMVDVPPTSLKKFITGKGTSQKDSIMLEIYKRWGFESETNNIADAFGLAMVGVALTGVDLKMPKASLESLSSIKKSFEG